MDNTEEITFQINSETKEKAEALFHKLGLTLESAINRFLCQAVKEQARPFKSTDKDSIQYRSREELDKIAEKVYDEHPDFYKGLAK